MIEIACSPTPDGRSRWTLPLLEEQAKIVLDTPVGRTAIGRALKTYVRTSKKASYTEYLFMEGCIGR